jgi:hypothetical protein
MRVAQVPALYVLEDVICRVRALDPNGEHFRSECWELAARIIGQRANDFGPLWKDAALLFLEGVLMYEALLAQRHKRPPSFADIVQRLRASTRPGNPDVPELTTLDVLADIPTFPRLVVLQGVLKQWLEEKAHHAHYLATAAIDDLLKEAAEYASLSPREIEVNNRAKLWRTKYWRRGDKVPPLKK